MMRAPRLRTSETGTPGSSLEELEARLGVRTITTEERRRELLASIAEYERSHGCSSAEMFDALCAGAYDTPEMAFWMADYRALVRLEQRAGIETDTPPHIVEAVMRPWGDDTASA